MASNQSYRLFWATIKKYSKLTLLILPGFVFFILLILFTAGQKFKHDNRNENLVFGVSFSARQVEKFGLNPDEVLNALIYDAGFKRFRLMSYWSDIEKTKGVYDFSELDRQIDTIKKANGEVTLAIGLRQPRWPECFAPSWTKNEAITEYRDDLNNFIKETMGRYKDNPTIESWQLENEFHLDVFGNCPDHSRQRLIEEYALAKSIDTEKPILLSLANNYFGFPVGKPRPDVFGVSVYSRVYESRVLKRYVTYPFPSWYYGGRAGITKILTGRNSILHELQLEPWGTKDIWEMTIKEQDESMDIKRVKKQMVFAEQIGFKTIDLWGGEWWYWRKEVLKDPSIWDAVKSHINQKD